MRYLERNNSNALTVYEMMFDGCRPREAVGRFMGEDHIHHNPHVATGMKASSITSSAWRASGQASASR